jgi:hypothetical protein
MSTRKRCLVVVFLLLPVPARADRHKWEMMIAPVSNVKRSNLWGGNLGGALTLWSEPPTIHCSPLPLPCKGVGPYACSCIGPGGKFVPAAKQPPRKWILAALGDVGYHWGEHEGANFTQMSLAGGLRMTYASHKSEPFGHVLAGLVQSHTTGIIDNNFLVGVGGGFDVVFLDRYVARLQVDYFKVFSAGGDDTYPRITLGFVYRFEPRH